MTAKFVFCVLIWPLPWFLRRLVFKYLFNYEIDRTAYIGRSIICCQKVRLGPGARIGDFTIIRNLGELSLGRLARIGTFNWIHGYIGDGEHFKDCPGRVSKLELHDSAAITARHILDCTDLVSLGSHSIIAGHRSQILTHGISFSENKQMCSPVEIGRYCFIGTNSLVLRGSKLPNYSIIGAGSVYTISDPQDDYSLFVGNPAQKVKTLSKEYAYFNRTVGVVL